MKNDKDKKFDQFLISKIKTVKNAPASEWRSIHSEIHNGNSKVEVSWFMQLWPSVMALVFSLSIILYNYNLYNVNEVDSLLEISFSTDKSWGASASLINIFSDSKNE